MVCSRPQGRLTLGPDAIAEDPTTPWAMRETIRNAAVWTRTSQTVDALAWALGYSTEDMDAMFEAARMVVV